MKKFIAALYRHPWVVTALIALITVFFALRLPKAELDNNNFRFVPEEDEARRVSSYIDDVFGSSLFVLVGLERTQGTVFDPAFLELLSDYVERIEGVELAGTINSIVSSDYIAGNGDSIVVENLVRDDFSGTPREIEELKQRILSWDLYRRALVSDDYTATQVLVPLEIDDDDAGKPEVIDSFIRIRDIAREMFAGSANVYVTGLPVISATINEAVRADLVLLVPLVIIVVLCILFFSFRRITGVILPVLTVVIAAIWSMGAMPLTGVKLSVLSTVLPVILVAVGSAYGIHVITQYIGEEEKKGELTREAHRELVIGIIHKIGKAVFLAALTTFVGFSSFCFTSVLPIREFGFFSGFGVIVSFIVAMTLIPSLLIIRGPRVMKVFGAGKTGGEKAGGGSPVMDNLVADVFVSIVRKKRFVLFITFLVTCLGIYGVSRVIIDNVFIEYFREDTDISRSDRFIREKFGGSKVVSVVARADAAETLLHPDSLAAMDGLSRYLENRVPEVGKVMGFTDLIKRMNQVFNADESPEGIRARDVPVSGGGDDDFGFDFGFGFDESPWDEAGDAGIAAVEEEGKGAETSGAGDPGLYGMGDIAGLLERAVSSGSRRSMDSEELIWELKRLVNYGGAAYYEIPVDPRRYGKTDLAELQRLVSGYLILLAGNIENYSNDPLEPTAIKTTVQLRTLGEEDTNRALDAINGYIKANFPGNIETFVGGSAMVEQSLNRLVVQSQIVSVFISLLAVFLIIALSNRSVAAGLIGIFPLSISILLNFAVMGFLKIKLNLGTSMVASVSVGIGIDYTIHYLEAFKREYGTGREDFLRKTFTTSGKAIIINALSVGAGFAVLLFSKFVMLGDLGRLIAFTMATSALVSLTVIPVLLLIIKPKFLNREKNDENR